MGHPGDRRTGLLDGKVVLVNGGSQGVGAAVAFHDAGDDWRERAAERLPMGRLGQPDEIAGFVVLLPSDRSGVVTGSVLDWDQNVLGGLD